MFVYTVRHTGDAHFGAGTGHGDGIWENGGFAVHFFARDLVDALADGWESNEVHASWRADFPAVCGASPRPGRGSAAARADHDGTSCTRRA
ncbi:hypothetical protein [Streptomyces yanii]|uniref:hypothetical protein n=1 Tax=Streptomyces yanii TaxID=78510 RepID=UPI0031E672D1